MLFVVLDVSGVVIKVIVDVIVNVLLVVCYVEWLECGYYVVIVNKVLVGGEFIGWCVL